MNVKTEIMAEATPEEQLRRVRQRDLFQTYFFKVAARTFGPPKSRERVIIAPPMPTADRDLQLTSDPAPPGPAVGQRRPRRAPPAPLAGADPAPQEPESGPPAPRDEAVRELQGWMAQRKEFRRQLDSMGDVRKWVRSKPVVSELEASVGERGEARPRSEQGDARKPPVKPGVGPPQPKKPPRKHAAPPPVIRRPSPQAVSALQRYLHAHRLRLTELFLRLDRRRTGRVSRGDFRTVFEQEGIPVDEAQLDDLLVALSSGDVDTVSYRELVGGRRAWSLQTRQARKSRPAQGRAADTEPRPSAGQELGSGPEPGQQGAPSVRVSRGSPFLQVPLPCLRERRPLTLEDEEELGRLHRQRRRTAKLGSSDVEALARVWVVKTGRAAVDGHALPSTAGGQSGEAVDRYRRACLRELMDTLQLCQERGLALSEATLERALLHPGDRLLRASDPLLKLRQPGTSPAARTLGQKSAWGDRREKEEEEKAFSAGMSQPRVGTDRPVYPPRKAVERGRQLVKLSTGQARIGRRTDCWLTFEEYASITRDSPQRPSRRANPDAFWPGRDLETVRLLLPETGRVPEEVLFRPVRRGPAPRPSSWPACAQGLFISGDSVAHKSPLLP
ncbi:EF-hand calcium-binding domain-containing protein 12 isoform X2 [Lepisosteus oculatus]|uniref:EF-hand calcium-binding domain-containing protein 12 isoform X2 n=1 Tax=Lepisosteus oculatus TaxID=7918 RepID=UPI003724BAA5